MPIQVICPGCHTRFSVSEQFAGKKGPCPKCKREIRVPTAAEKVTVHEPEGFGPKDSAGKSVLKPIFRKDTRLSALQIVAIVGMLVIAIGAAITVNLSDTEPASSTMWAFLGIGAVFLAPLLTLGGYSFLRNQELEPYRGQALWLRVAICGALFAGLWMILPVVEFTAGDYSLVPVIIGLVVMSLIGGGVSLATLELDYLMGVLHYGLYLGTCIALRWIAGVGPVPLVSDG